MLSIVLLSLIAFADPSADSLDRLASADPAERYRAVVELSDADLGPDAVPFIRKYIEREVVDMEADLPARYAVRPVPYDPLPRDTSEVRLRASPQAHLGEIFTVVGQMAVTDHFVYGYRDAKGTHYSIEVAPMNGKGQLSDDRLHAYISRAFGTILIERLAAAEERKVGHLVARLKVTLPSDREFRYDTMLEVFDWQFYDTETKTWTPWALESLGQGIGLLARTGKPTALVEVITQQTPHGTVSADGFVRYAATLHIAKMDKPQRNRAIREIKKAFTQARKAKNDELTAILNRAAAIILREGK